MGETLSLFTTTFNRSLSVEARREHLSSDAGAVLLREILEHCGLIEHLTAKLTDPRDPMLVTHSLADLLRTSLILIGQGWRDQSDADTLREDPALRLAVCGDRGGTPLEEDRHLPSQPTLSRLLDTLSGEANRQVLREALLEMAGRRLRAERRGHRPHRLTIDVDSLPIEVHGHQPNSAWNGHYHQRMYHPIIAAVAETGDLVDARLRPGNAHTAAGALDFVLDLVDRAKKTLCRVAMVRFDAGFPEERVLAGLEGRRIAWVARLRNNPALDRAAAPFLKRPRGRPPVEPRLWFHEMDWKAGAWSRSRRVVLVVLERPGELLLDHFFLVTSIAADVMPAADLLEHYRRRGAAEGLFGELMDTLAPILSSAPRTRFVKKGKRKIPGVPTGIDAFARNEVLLILNMLAYEVLHTGRRVMEIVTGIGWSLRRFRETVLKVGAHFVLHARRITMIVAQSASKAWSELWPKLHRLAWSGP
mgnify:CR=1 FL=1